MHSPEISRRHARMETTLRFITVLASLFLLTWSMTGCSQSKSPPPRTYKVEGIVVFKSGEIYTTGGAIEFRHETQSGATSIGEIQTNGKFVVRTLTGEHKVPGALEGPHTVTIIPASREQNVQPIFLKKKYVVAAGDNNLTIDVDD